MKRILVFILCVIMTFGAFSVFANAATADDGKLYAVTMGIRKYSANETVGAAKGFASVTYTRHSTGETGSKDKIYDVKMGETFTITTKINEGLEDFYTFVAWVDSKGIILSEETSIEITVDGSVAVFAAYAENASRHTVTYSFTGEGEVSVSSNLPLQSADGIVSVMEGANVTFEFTPEEEYSVYIIKLNGERFSMFKYACERFVRFIEEGEIKDAFSEIINFFKIWFGKEGTLTIENVDKDITFEVGFMKPAF